MREVRRPALQGEGEGEHSRLETKERKGTATLLKAGGRGKEGKDG